MYHDDPSLRMETLTEDNSPWSMPLLARAGTPGEASAEAAGAVLLGLLACAASKALPVSPGQRTQRQLGSIDPTAPESKLV